MPRSSCVSRTQLASFDEPETATAGFFERLVAPSRGADIVMQSSDPRASRARLDLDFVVYCLSELWCARGDESASLELALELPVTSVRLLNDRSWSQRRI
jgi:hypothetical protein